MTKYYITDGENRFLVDSTDHLRACGLAVKSWKNKQKDIGKFICFSNIGFTTSGNNSIDTKIIEGINLKNG